MRRSLFVLMQLLLISVPCFGQQSLPGTYRLVSLVVEVDGQQPVDTMGKSPRGYVVLTPTRWINMFTAENRKFGTSIEQKAALWDSLLAFTGPYRLDGNKLIVSIDASWNESWNGTQVTRYWQMVGNRLTITSEKAPYSRDPTKMAVGRFVLEKVE
jgi:lipocalin-like protein